MELFFVILFLASGFFINLILKAKFRTLRNPISIFSFVWTIVGVGANLRLYGYYSPSMFVNVSILISMWLLCILSILFYNNPQYYTSLDNENYNSNFNYRFFLIINFSCIIVMMPQVISAASILISNGFAFLRANASYANTGIYVAGWQAALFSSIIRPIILSSTIISIALLFSSEQVKIKRNCILLSIFETILMVILTAGRGSLVNFTFYILIAVILFSGKNIVAILFRYKKLLLMVLLLGVGVIYVTSLRDLGNASWRFLENIYVYYFSGPSYMTQLLEYETRYGINGEKLYGTATFGFISNWFSAWYMLLFGGQSGSLWLMGSQITNKQYWVGDHTLINAMCTAFYTFIVDWGIMGIFLGTIVIFCISKIIMKYMTKKRNLKAYSIMIFWIYLIIRTVFKWDLIDLDFSVFLVCIYIYTMRVKIKY